MPPPYIIKKSNLLLLVRMVQRELWFSSFLANNEIVSSGAKTFGTVVRGLAFDTRIGRSSNSVRALARCNSSANQKPLSVETGHFIPDDGWTAASTVPLQPTVHGQSVVLLVGAGLLAVRWCDATALGMWREMRCVPVAVSPLQRVLLWFADQKLKRTVAFAACKRGRGLCQV
jgi:hypothetical protein